MPALSIPGGALFDMCADVGDERQMVRRDARELRFVHVHLDQPLPGPDPDAVERKHFAETPRHLGSADLCLPDRLCLSQHWGVPQC